MKRILIIGHLGQDGQLLSRHLREQGHEVFGLGRNGVENLTIRHGAKISLENAESIEKLIKVAQPDEVYFLAAYHNASEDELPEDKEVFRLSFETNTAALVNVLEALKNYAPRASLFYASSSQIFGLPQSWPQDENTKVLPRTIYGISKAAGMEVCRYYRDRYQMFVSIGILYNHESYLRTKNFVSKKIIHAVTEISRGRLSKLELRDLSARADWGYAGDYVEAMQRMLAHSEPADFIVATGVMHTIKDWVEYAFAQCGLDWRDFVIESKMGISASQPSLCGNSKKLRRATNWSNTIDFHGLIDGMLAFEQSQP